MSGGSRSLIFVKHAHPTIDAGRPPAEWRLSADGVAGASALAARLTPLDPNLCLTSPEPKAMETAAAVAEGLGLEVRVIEDLREHERHDGPWLPTETAFREAIAELFARPGHVVFGSESGVAAERRFARALDGALDATDRARCTVVVSHGTVISLYLAARTGAAALDIWDSLAFCGAIAVPWPVPPTPGVIRHV